MTLEIVPEQHSTHRLHNLFLLLADPMSDLEPEEQAREGGYNALFSRLSDDELPGLV